MPDEATPRDDCSSVVCEAAADCTAAQFWKFAESPGSPETRWLWTWTCDGTDHFDIVVPSYPSLPDALDAARAAHDNPRTDV